MGMSMSRKANACPLCGKPQVAESKPFCSQGCKDRDLLKWLDEGYRVPAPLADYEDSFGSEGAD
ncbi:zinc-binding protein [Sphingomonadaceae bacterium]|mgnify:CR=1 FL=1|jgi:hypothetical protein